MNNRMKDILNKNNAGAALIFTTIVTTVLLMFCVSLLMISYSLFSSTQKSQDEEKCKQTAVSLSNEIEKELTQSSVLLTTADELQTKLENKADPDVLWRYLRCNLWQTNWPYFNEDPDESTGHKQKNAYRVFKLTHSNTNMEQFPEKTTVTIYWESDKETVKAAEADSREKEDTAIYVIVKCENHGASYEIKSEYELGMAYSDITEEEKHKYCVTDTSVNPTGNTIDLAENWSYTLIARE